MMYTLKGWRATATLLLLFASCRGDPPGWERQPQQRYNGATATVSPHLAPSWEYILQEIIHRSIAPPQSPLDAGVLYKRPLDASFYGGPLATRSNDDTNVILSRGNVYRLLNGHWILCQDECVNCEPCAAQRDPLFSWNLRRIERSRAAAGLAGSPRHEFQLTITPQMDDRLHASDFWPNSYIYVVSQGGKRRGTSIVNVSTPPPDNGISNVRQFPTSSGLEDSSPAQHHRSRNPGPLAEPDPPNHANRDDDPTEPKQRLKTARPQYQPRPRITENPEEEASQLAPKLVLGIDRRGQKHLIHVIQADHSPVIIDNPLIANQPLVPSWRLFVNQTMPSKNAMVAKREEKQTYQRIFRRVVDSLNTHRRSIENFLEMDNAGGDHGKAPPATDGMDVAGFARNNRGVNHIVANVTPLYRGDTTLSLFYRPLENEGRTAERRQHRGGHSYEDTKQNVINGYSARYRDTDYADTSRRQSPMSFDRGEERRRLLIRPYSVNSRGTSGISSSISSQASGNSSADGNLSFGNGFVNSTLVDSKASNNSIGPDLGITTRRGNGQLFRADRRPKSDDANREFEAPRQPFRMIITTESPVIPEAHEAVNHAEASQTTTLKTFADAS